MKKLLVVEDERLLRNIIKEYFGSRDYEVIEAIDGFDALNKITPEIDLVLLDIMMPGMNGYEVCKEMRKEYNVPIIFMSALSEVENQLDAYSLGADDYITKPFKPSILFAKCNALISRLQKENKSTIHLGHLIIDTVTHSLSIDGEDIPLAYKEYQLLEYFIKNEGKVLTRQQILDHVWGYDYFGDGRAIDTYIKKLRKKLGPYAYYIQTMIKMGYLFKIGENNEKTY